MKKEIKKAPTIRFRGFTNDWEQRKFPEFVEFYNGLTYTPSDVQDSGTLVLRSSNVKNGEVVDADNVYVNPQKVASENVKNGDIIVVVRNGSRALIGKHAEIKEEKPNTVIGAFMTGIRSEYPSFVNALLDTSKFEKEIEKNMGATINQITGYMFSKMEFMIPSVKEQAMIGNYFKSIDNLITLHQRKFDELKTAKKFFLQNMFPAKGEKVPRIRFQGFTGDWEQRKLGDVCNQLTGTINPQTRPNELFVEYSMPAYDSGMKPNIVYGFTMNSTRKIVNESCLLINKLNVRKKRIWYIKNPTKNAVCSAEFIPLYSDNIDLLFLNYVVSRDSFTNYLEDCSSGSSNSQKRVTPDIIIEAKVFLPVKDEQLKIGSYFQKIDNLITLHQHKLDQLKTLKKFMLQNLFI